jgi:hypothetical protein
MYAKCSCLPFVNGLPDTRLAPLDKLVATTVDPLAAQSRAGHILKRVKIHDLKECSVVEHSAIVENYLKASRMDPALGDLSVKSLEQYPAKL